MTNPNIQMDENLIYGLIIAAERHPDQKMRLEAVRQLASLPHPQVHNALAALALWDGSKQVREAAFKVLQNVFGDDTDAFLKDFQSESEPLEEEDLGDEPEEELFESDPEDEADDEGDEFDEDEFGEGDDAAGDTEEFYEEDEDAESADVGDFAPVARPMYTEHSPGQSPVMTREGTPWWVWVVLWGGVLVVAWLLSGR